MDPSHSPHFLTTKTPGYVTQTGFCTSVCLYSIMRPRQRVALRHHNIFLGLTCGGTSSVASYSLNTNIGHYGEWLSSAIISNPVHHWTLIVRYWIIMRSGICPYGIEPWNSIREWIHETGNIVMSYTMDNTQFHGFASTL